MNANVICNFWEIWKIKKILLSSDVYANEMLGFIMNKFMV